MLARLEEIDIDVEQASIDLRFPSAGRTGKEVYAVEGVAKAYGDLQVYEDLNLTIWRRQRVALVGPNGAGKSTLLKMFARDTPIQGGRIYNGANVRAEYFAQHQIQALDPRLTVYQEAQRAASDETVTMIRNTLGALLFRGAEVDKKVAILSGGERARLALCKIVLRAPSVLLLDEPTNHLDLLSREVLERALARFDGTIVMVSHDRYFINSVADHVLEVMPGGKTRLYQGDYDAYLYRKSGGDPAVIERLLRGEMIEADTAGQRQHGRDADAERKVSRQRQRDQRRTEAELRNALSRQTRPLKTRIGKLEQEIERDEARLAEIQQLQLDPSLYDDHERVANLAEEQHDLKEQVDRALGKWTELSGRLEAIEERDDDYCE
jgi:ATP-binding cassette subfamily F protein 3